MGNAIVVGYDGSKTSDKAVDAAIELAKDMADSELMIACGMHQPDDLLEIGRRDEVRFQAEGYWQEMLPHVTKALEEQAEKARAAGVKAATACTPGDPAEVMMNVAKDVGARLIVVGSTGAGLVAEMVGSTTLRLLRKSKLPVLVVPKG